MSHVPENLKYTKTHEWARVESDGSVTIGITDHAQHLLGDMVYVELPKVNHDIQKEQEIAVVESVKAASDVYSPLSGKVIAINPALSTQPELINEDPYDKGWIFRLNPNDQNELNQLLTSQTYQQQISSEN
jgi:glycine cleavage system H protein